jgi:hypothetical protein
MRCNRDIGPRIPPATTHAAHQQVREQERQERAASVAEKAAAREQKQAAIAAGRRRAQQLSGAADHAVERLHLSVASQIALLYMRDLLEADPALENVELSEHVHAIDPATGQRDFPCLISFAVDRDRYAGLNLRDVTPAACLKHLNALVSKHPHAVEPVTPVRDFDLARYSFVESIDVVAELDSRPDLTKMTPDEFEHFVRQLFEARGLEGRTTERTGDDGVDAVVLNRDPMVGGLTIVQAKKYTRVLGVRRRRCDAGSPTPALDDGHRKRASSVRAASESIDGIGRAVGRTATARTGLRCRPGRRAARPRPVPARWRHSISTAGR